MSREEMKIAILKIGINKVLESVEDLLVKLEHEKNWESVTKMGKIREMLIQLRDVK